MATAAPKLSSGVLSVPSPLHRRRPPSLLPLRSLIADPGKPSPVISSANPRREVLCKATEVSVAEDKGTGGGGSDDGKNWIPVVPLAALPKGERRVIIQDGETILLLWYKDEVFAIENRSPAEAAYSEGLLNAKLTQDGCIVCPTTDSTFDLRTGAIKEWYPKNPVLRVLTPPLRTLFVYPVKYDDQNIYISLIGGVRSDAVSAEIVFMPTQCAKASKNQAVEVSAPTIIASSAADYTASEVVRQFYGGINRRDLASVEGLIAENCIYEDLIFPRPFIGRKEILEFFQKFINSISTDLQFVIDDISEEDTSALGVSWHLEWKGRPFPFSKGCSFYRVNLLDGKRQIMFENSYGRDCVEPAFKPGETALVVIRGVTWLLQQFPQLADRL